MRMQLWIVAVWAVFLSGCQFDGLLARNTVAQANDQKLTVSELADILAHGKVQLESDMVEQWVWSWLQSSLYAQRLAAGESVTDTASVLESMWPEAMGWAVFHLAERDGLDTTAAVDSAFLAGDDRILDQILIRVTQGIVPEDKAALRRRAARLRARLLAGILWDTVAARTRDLGRQATAGSIGLVERGQLAPEVEKAGFSLAPGAVSGVVESSFGFHILRRPRFDEVNVQYSAFALNKVLERWKSQKREELLKSHDVRLEDDAADVLRDAVKHPMQLLATDRKDLIGEYDGGRFTNRDFIHWLQALPVQEHLAADTVDNEGLRRLARRLIANDLIYAEAKSEGVGPTKDEYAAMSREYTGRLAELRWVMRIDTLLIKAATPAERMQAAADATDDYLKRQIETLRDVRVVPPFLAQRLRDEADWKFSYDALDRAVERARRLRARTNER